MNWLQKLFKTKEKPWWHGKRFVQRDVTFSTNTTLRWGDGTLAWKSDKQKVVTLDLIFVIKEETTSSFKVEYKEIIQHDKKLDDAPISLWSIQQVCGGWMTKEYFKKNAEEF